MKVHERYIGRVYESKLSLELFIIKLTKQITITSVLCGTVLRLELLTLLRWSD